MTAFDSSRTQNPDETGVMSSIVERIGNVISKSRMKIEIATSYIPDPIHYVSDELSRTQVDGRGKSFNRHVLWHATI